MMRFVPNRVNLRNQVTCAANAVRVENVCPSMGADNRCQTRRGLLVMIMEPSSNELSVHNVSSLLDDSTITEGERFGISCFGRHRVDMSYRTKAPWSDYIYIISKDEHFRDTALTIIVTYFITNTQHQRRTIWKVCEVSVKRHIPNRA